MNLTDTWSDWSSSEESAGAGALAPLTLGNSSAVRSAVRDRLRMAITLRQLPVGERLNQVELAKQLGVSRMPVRDALSDLVAEGLVDTLPGGGVAVRPLTAADLRGLYAVRAVLELEAVRSLEPNGNWRDELTDILASHHRPLERDQRDQLLLLDRRFHWALYKGTGNQYLCRAMTPVWSQISRAMFELMRLENYSSWAWAEHQQIAEALASGDRARAEELTKQHLDGGLNTLLASLEQQEKA